MHAPSVDEHAHDRRVASAERPRRPVESRDPVTGEVWKSYEAAGPEEVRRAVDAARVAQRDWGALPVAERARALQRFHEVLVRRRRDLVDVLARENGKPAAEAYSTELLIVLDFARFYARRAPRALRGESFAAAGPLVWRKRVSITYVPYGVVGVIAPWNYPFMLAAGVVLPALVAGNSVVLKPSEFTPGSGLLLGELLHEAGVPPAVTAVLPGDGVTGAALVESGVDKVSFTGSVATGRRVAVACAERLVPCSLELGGSDPAIVLADADIGTAASGIAWGRFSNGGQTCTAPKRVFVVDAVYERFIEALRRTVSGLAVGGGSDASDVAPLIRPSQTAALHEQLDDALARGAHVVAAAAVRPGSSAEYFPPTVLADVVPSMRVLSEETFGPLLPVVRVRDEDDAVAQANASEFGLSASVWSRDIASARRVAERLEAGSVSVNDAAVAAGMADVPHGGVKASGTGRSHGVAGLLEYVRTKTIVVDRFSAWRQVWWFGYTPSHVRDLDGLVQFAHGRRLGERARGLARTIRLLLRPGRAL